MIKNVVFDMGGVLIDYNSRKTITTYFPEEHHDILMKEVFGSVTPVKQLLKRWEKKYKVRAVI